MIKVYPNLKGKNLDSCVTCHAPAKKNFLNDYGLEFKAAKYNFKEIEHLDSDGDGYSNISEMKNFLFPGSKGFRKNGVFVYKAPKKGTVLFDHQKHILNAEYKSDGQCIKCHHKQGGFLKAFNEDSDIKDRSHQLCVNCHTQSRSKKAPQKCLGCHKQ
jgi:hypothetical protein